MAKKKLKAIGKLTDEAAVLLQKIVRLKAADFEGNARCVTCDSVKHWKELQGGHFIPRGNAATKLMEENIHPQCMGCNGFGMKYGDAEKHYTLFMIDTYGRDEMERMMATRGKVHKWVRADLMELIPELKQQVKDLMEEKGL